MNITLRKANAIQNSINDALKSIKMVTTIDINEFQNVETEIQTANDKLMANDARRQQLTMSLYNIRALVGAANAQSGIDVNLAKAAFIDKRIGQLEEIAGLSPHTSLDVINGKLEKIRNDKGESRRSFYSLNEGVTTTVVNTTQIDQAKAEILNLKKQKQKINDEILELNIKTEIPLSDDTVATLQAEGLL